MNKNAHTRAEMHVLYKGKIFPKAQSRNPSLYKLFKEKNPADGNSKKGTAEFDCKISAQTRHIHFNGQHPFTSSLTRQATITR